MIHSVLRPDRKGYNRLCRELERLEHDFDCCADPKERAQIQEEIHETERAIFQTGVMSEYDA